VIRFLQRGETGPWQPAVRRMLLGACLSGVPLLATWASIQWAPAWANKLLDDEAKAAAQSASESSPGRETVQPPPVRVNAAAYTQMGSAGGAIIGCIIGAMMGDWFGRRIAYSLLCVAALGACVWFFRGNDSFNAMFLVAIFVAGATTAAFYGWLPLYLPELFPTRMRAMGQGFSFNFGRVLAAVGALQVGNLMKLFEGGYPEACSVMSLIYLVGLAIIWLAPETRGKPLPD
jgi:MFS transporter, SHS family, sialic acid transporter